MLDKHIVKMPTESCQMLHTNVVAIRYEQENGRFPTLRESKQYHSERFPDLMIPSMLNHPSTIWARESYENYVWLYSHAIQLCKEFTARYDKIHGTEQRILDTPQLTEDDFPISELTPLRIAMMDKYRIEQNPDEDDWDFVVRSYRHYYLEGKWQFATWRRNRPDWYTVTYQENMQRKQTEEFNRRWNIDVPEDIKEV
tara:strand:+ start:1517 stop:2110 length:594 start_codon:yes stop_codon:yes gene_type:complete